MTNEASYMSLKCIPMLLALLLAGALSLKAQPKATPAGNLTPKAIEQLHAAEDTLALLAYAVVNDSIEKQRFGACRALITTLVRSLKIENSFKYKFERLQSVSVLTPPDSSFRIFTWQLYVNDSTYRYYGAIQLNQRELKLFPVIDRSMEMDEPPLHEQLLPDHWYGALYYNIRQFDTKEGRKYLLFGYDAYQFFVKRKIIDVLSFDHNDKPIFGAPVFFKADKPDFPDMRFVIEYSSEAKVRLNWDEQYKMVLFDHLIDMPSPFGRGITSVPDGSYDGFKLEKGKWKFIDKVFHDVNAEVPMPSPILDGRKGRDIVGKPKQ